jgi:hypothetical protein
VHVEAAVGGVGQYAVRRAAVADAQGQRAGVDAGEAGDVVGAQPGVERRGGAPVGRLGHVLLHDQTEGGHVDGLVVLRRGADIADMGEGEGDELAGIGGVGEGLLVAGHAGVEADLADPA